ncbi:MAG: TSUP family transporter [Syntrophaceae bacterium]
MEYVVIAIASFLISGLTLFSGFGLGTLLLPFFALFFPLDMAVALTAVVHLLNNLFKLVLLGRKADRAVVLRFGIPAIVASFAGAEGLLFLSGMNPLCQYALGGKIFFVTPLKVAIAVLIIVFALFEIVPRLARLSFDRRYLVLGGVLSGFFGGLSGHQGALRSAFLLRAGLSPEGFIATGVVIACLVDIVRVPVYITHFSSAVLGASGMLLVVATLAAFLGAFIGNRLAKKVTMRYVQIVVAVMLFVIAIGLGTGLI